MGFFPPSSCQFESVLHHMPMAAFNFARADGKLLLARPGVVQVLSTLAEISIGVCHWRFDCSRRFLVLFQTSEDFRDLLIQQPALLPMEPLPLLADTSYFGRCRCQIFADVEKVDQVSTLDAKVVFELFHNPRRSVAHPVDK